MTLLFQLRIADVLFTNGHVGSALKRSYVHKAPLPQKSGKEIYLHNKSYASKIKS